ncbi:YegS/Rv2252/BmrU family lipid kinase [Leptolyngbya sp. FACHB-711]|uniref:diacylglycerol/lipid kinase family protein n=1 Tax=unclassified Leptolyngbya TaxID=2650499 RepID=UPI00168570A2|nr:YegS/Rv2252/BmrU family lipid kinase [Leptolyngbya sp. FACHB-711]MBD1849124.1 YegS/Rv2252/BmrU family lipid kinase [Cyanobacteria bacterium FACHB-502]MBD2028149.1 YegS/Rv2252/BmrU family lipid kinase [Leptolyngbya sp. FACHB-711]
MNTRLIVNPTSGPVENPELLTDLAEALQTQGIQAEICTTTPDEDGEGLAADAAKAGAKLVIVAGGDGTIEAVARGLVHTQTMLGIIPLGTRNNIAASLNISNDLTQAIQILVEGEHGRFDMGKANNYYFMEVVGVGLEASLFPCGDEVKEGIKKNYLVALKSIFSGVKTFLQFSPHRLVLRFDGRRIRRLRTLQVNICNSPRYGVEFALAPEAKMNDGKLDVIYIDNPSKWDHLRYFFTAMRGEQLPHKRLNTYRASKIEVRSYPPLDVHADGECLGTTPVTVEVIPRALWICVPTPELLAKFADESGSPVLTQ